jgi:hypothetical protein
MFIQKTMIAGVGQVFFGVDTISKGTFIFQILLRRDSKGLFGIIANSVLTVDPPPLNDNILLLS